MLNINELETKWFKYKVKSYIPHAVITMSLLIIVTIAFVTFNSLSTTNSNSTNTIKTIIPIEELNHPTVVQKELSITPEINITEEKSIDVHEIISINNKEKIILTPSLNFMKNMQDDTPPYYDQIEKEEEYQEVQNLKSEESKVSLPKDNSHEIKEEIIILEPFEDVKKEDSINITRQNTQEDISHVIKRFKKNNNPTLSLFVAKKYYEMGEYRQAYNYSLITNQLNNNIESSWIIFTKSLVKLNEKDMAIKTLKQYVEHSHSSQAKILLDEITSGKFK